VTATNLHQSPQFQRIPAFLTRNLTRRWNPGERGAPLPDGEGERARALRRLAHEFKITWGPLWARVIVYSTAFLGGLAGLEALISSAG
jgi:hypothetical protein